MAPVVGPKYKLLARYGNNVQEVCNFKLTSKV
jgi:hypothetical protein